MGVPAPLVWATLSFFAAFIPRLGFYVGAIPPVLMAFTIDATTALWVGIFYIVLSEILGNFVGPKIYGELMDLHPAYVLFMTIAMGMAFGLVGVLVATPLAGILQVYFEEFYRNRLPEDELGEQRVQRLMEAGWPRQARQ
jgi:putative permease